MRQFIREPLFHFLLMGVGLFIFFDVLPREQSDNHHRIVISDATVEMIAQRHQATWKRAPTAAELEGLINTYLREEILYREGLLMGFDKNDGVIRRRILQKISVLTEEVASQQGASIDDLNAYLDSHQERYLQAAVLKFDQVLFDPVRHGEQLDPRLALALEALRAGAKHQSIGDSSLLSPSFAGIDANRLARDFGKPFADELQALPIGQWVGPVRSGYGQHLVRVNEAAPARPSTLEEVRIAVNRDWESERRINAAQAYVDALRASYEVIYESAMPPKALQ